MKKDKAGAGRPEKRTEAWTLALISVVFSFLVLMPYLHGHWRLADDAYYAYLQRYLLQERILKFDGSWEHWLLNISAGQPASMVPGQTLFYPVQVLWGLLVGWSEKSYVWYLWMHLAAAGTFLAVFARQAGLSMAASAFFAMVMTGNGFVIGALSNPNLLLPHLYWPVFISGLIDLHLNGGKHEARGVMKIAIGAFLLEVLAYPLFKVLIAIASVVGYWAMAREQGSWVRGLKLKPLFIGVGIALIASSPEWATNLPTLRFIDRLSEDIYNEYTYNSPTNFLILATAILPGVFIKRGATQLGMLWVERSWWVGSLTIGIILSACWMRRESLKRLHVPMLIAFFVFLFTMGGHSMIRELSAVLITPLEHLRHSDYARFLVMTFIAWWGATSLNDLETGLPAKPSSSGHQKVVLLWTLFLVACTAVALSSEAALNQVHASLLYSNDIAGWKIQALHTSFYLLLAYTVVSQRWVAGGRWKWPAIVVAIQVLSMGDGAYAMRSMISEQRAYASREEFSLPAAFENRRSMRRWFDGNDWISWHGTLPVFWGHNAPYHRWKMEAFNDPVASQMLPTLVSCRDNLPGVPAIPGASCGGTKFEITHYFGNVIEVRGSGSAPAFVMAHDFWHPYWTGSVNDRPAELLQAHKFFKALEVPAGSWAARFEYRNPLFPFLWYLAGVGFALMLSVPFWYPRLAQKASRR